MKTFKDYLEPKEEINEEDKKAIDSIKWLIDNDWGKDDKNQGIASQMFKGLSFSQEDIANKFMDEVNKFTSTLKDKYLKGE